MSGRRPERWLVQDLSADARLQPAAVALKLSKLARDPFAFFRGILPEYARWVRRDLRDFRDELARPRGLVTGDLHLENFGTFSGESGEIVFDLNDFDEATRAPLVIDLRRLAGSAGLASIVAGDGRAAVTAAIDAVLEGVCGSARKAPACVVALVASSRVQAPDSLLGGAVTLSSGRPRLLDGGSKAPLDPAIVAELRQAVRPLKRQHGDPMSFLDATRRLAGNGSLGRRRYLILVAEGPMRQTLLDFKEARPSAWGAVNTLLGATSRAAQVTNAARALRVESEDLLSVATVSRRRFQVKEHSPHGLKLAAAKLSTSDRRHYARYTGWLLARSWKHSGQPFEQLVHQLEGRTLARLRTGIQTDIERTLEDYRSFIASRERIEGRLGLDARAA